MCRQRKASVCWAKEGRERKVVRKKGDGQSSCQVLGLVHHVSQSTSAVRSNPELEVDSQIT